MPTKVVLLETSTINSSRPKRVDSQTCGHVACDHPSTASTNVGTRRCVPHSHTVHKERGVTAKIVIVILVAICSIYANTNFSGRILNGDLPVTLSYSLQYSTYLVIDSRRDDHAQRTKVRYDATRRARANCTTVLSLYIRSHPEYCTMKEHPAGY